MPPQLRASPKENQKQQHTLGSTGVSADGEKNMTRLTTVFRHDQVDVPPMFRYWRYSTAPQLLNFELAPRDRHYWVDGLHNLP
jgi:hypothetical protein